MSEPTKVFEDREVPGQWRAEWFDDDGGCELEIFTGPRAAVRNAEIRVFQGSAPRTVSAGLVPPNSASCRASRSCASACSTSRAFHHVQDTIVFMGSARLLSESAAMAVLAEAEATGRGIEAAQTALRLSAYYEAARELARRLTEWSKKLGREERRFVVCTGGGPGIMEAANRGASEARGVNVGLTISIPDEDNPYVSRELHFQFHYFFMRKFWFVYLAKAVVLFPGGFGTLD
jgi:predicted Rossmann-fold nucleotide-binding protein